MNLKRNLIMFSLIFFLCTSLWSAVEATYVPEPMLRFYRGKGQGPYFMEASPNDTSATYFVAHLGTLTFHSTDGQLFDPRMINISTNINFVFYRPMDNGPENSVFRLASAYRNNNKEEWMRLDHGDNVNPLTNISGNINSTTYEVRIYLISDQSANRYIYNATYTWVSGDFGGFNVQTKKTTNTNTYDFIPVNGQVIPENGDPPAAPSPFLATGTAVPEPLPYGPPVYHTKYDFSIVKKPDFILTDAYTNNISIATANLQLVGTDPDKYDYKVQVKFTGANDTPDYFRLQHKDASPAFVYFIPYSLVFGGIAIQPSVSYDWLNLDKVNINSKDISVRIPTVSQAIAERAVEGTYVDTITVTITPL